MTGEKLIYHSRAFRYERLPSIGVAGGYLAPGFRGQKPFRPYIPSRNFQINIYFQFGIKYHVENWISNYIDDREKLDLQYPTRPHKFFVVQVKNKSDQTNSTAKENWEHDIADMTVYYSLANGPWKFHFKHIEQFNATVVFAKPMETMFYWNWLVYTYHMGWNGNWAPDPITGHLEKCDASSFYPAKTTAQDNSLITKIMQMNFHLLTTIMGNYTYLIDYDSGICSNGRKISEGENVDSYNRYQPLVTTVNIGHIFYTWMSGETQMKPYNTAPVILEDPRKTLMFVACGKRRTEELAYMIKFGGFTINGFGLQPLSLLSLGWMP